LNLSVRISQPFSSVFLSQQISISISISRSAVFLQLAEQGGTYLIWNLGSALHTPTPVECQYSNDFGPGENLHFSHTLLVSFVSKF
jgi:hypothetical protein